MLRFARITRTPSHSPTASEGNYTWNKEDIFEQAKQTQGKRARTEHQRKSASKEIQHLQNTVKEFDIKRNMSFDGMNSSQSFASQEELGRAVRRLRYLGHGDPTAPDTPVQDKMRWYPQKVGGNFKDWLRHGSFRAGQDVKNTIFKFDRRDPYGLQSWKTGARQIALMLVSLGVLRYLMSSTTDRNDVSTEGKAVVRFDFSEAADDEQRRQFIGISVEDPSKRTGTSEQPRMPAALSKVLGITQNR